MYILKEDIRNYEAALASQRLQFRYKAIEYLLSMRETTLFCPPEMLSRSGIRIQSYPVEVKMHLGGNHPPEEEVVEKTCSDIRVFFLLPPWTPRTSTLGNLMPQRELAMLHDVFSTFHVMYSEQRPVPRISIHCLSLQDDNCDTTYDSTDSYIYPLVLARDIMCGLLPGPCNLGISGMLKRYLKPLLDGWRAYTNSRHLSTDLGNQSQCLSGKVVLSKSGVHVLDM
ncbi:hypothetical protein BDZ89DRAFT_1111731 [Hymenopellis radicata]|nr:hypothetical protein BDZ89DRAFT_1111731 [Hymenopellis radicata]